MTGLEDRARFGFRLFVPSRDSASPARRTCGSGRVTLANGASAFQVAGSLNGASPSEPGSLSPSSSSVDCCRPPSRRMARSSRLPCASTRATRSRLLRRRRTATHIRPASSAHRPRRKSSSTRPRRSPRPRLACRTAPCDRSRPRTRSANRRGPRRVHGGARGTGAIGSDVVAVEACSRYGVACAPRALVRVGPPDRVGAAPFAGLEPSPLREEIGRPRLVGAVLAQGPAAVTVEVEDEDARQRDRALFLGHRRPPFRDDAVAVDERLARQRADAALRRRCVVPVRADLVVTLVRFAEDVRAVGRVAGEELDDAQVGSLPTRPHNCEATRRPPPESCDRARPSDKEAQFGLRTSGKPLLTRHDSR